MLFDRYSVMVMYSENGIHISASRLWEYSRDPALEALSDAERDHLAGCEDCTVVLWLCSISASVENLEKNLKAAGVDWA